MQQPLSFRDVQAYNDGDFAAGWRVSASWRPFWAVINDNELTGDAKDDQVLKWLNDTISQLLIWREPVTRVQRMNTMLYRGKHYFAHDEFYSLPYNRNRRYDKNQAKIVLNYIGQAVDQHVSDMSAYEPNLEVSPGNDDEQDKVSARMCKQALDHYQYLYDLKIAFQTFHRRKKIHGETFMFVGWDPNLGDYHPKFKQLRQMRQQQGQDPDQPIPLVDPTTGEPVMGEDGEPLFITKAVRVGDILITQEYGERVLYPHVESGMWEDVPYVHRLMWWDVDYVKARWPQHADKIKTDGMYRRFMGPNPKSMTQKVCVRYSYHKPIENLDKGFYCYSIESCLLESGPKEFNHDELPCIRGTDIDLPYETTGMSFIQNLASLNFAINNSTSMILQNQSLFSYPKYTVPRTAKVRYTDLGDDRGIYEYSGEKAPELVANNSTPPDVWKYRDAMRDEFKTLSAIYATSRGEAPDGLTANVALRMIDEQERKFHKPQIDKHGQNVEILGTLILATLGTYRDPADGALIKILGRNNERYLQYFDVTNLSKPYIVHLERSSGLPENPAAKTQTVLDLASQFQGLWSQDEVLEYLDIHRPEKLIESATVARQAAEEEVEDILAGVVVPPPTEYDDILPKYRVYGKSVQNPGFRQATPQIQNAMLSHIITAEYLISRKMRLNPLFSNQVMQQFPNFPMFFPIQPTMTPDVQLAQGMPQPVPGVPGLPIPPGVPGAQAGNMPINAPNLGDMPPDANAQPAPLAAQAPPGQKSVPPPGKPPQPNIPAAPQSNALP